MERDEAPWHAWLAHSNGWHMIDEIDLVTIVAVESDWLRLCARLERLADRLLAGVPQCEAISVCIDLRRLGGDPRDGFARRAEALFGKGANQPLGNSLIGHVAARHAARTVQCYDLIEALDPVSTEFDAETIGYMLRCFFEGCRQLVALERLALLELGRDRLTVAARALLTDRIIESCDAG
jgi:hypothetical protein